MACKAVRVQVPPSVQKPLSFLDRGFFYLINFCLNESCGLVGKEWQVGKGKNDLLSANFRINYFGENRVETIDDQSSINDQELIYGETNENLSFTDKFLDTPLTSFIISYRKYN